MAEPENTNQQPAAIPAAVLAFMNNIATPSSDKLSVSAAMNKRAREEEAARVQAEKDLDDTLNGGEASHLIGKALGDRGIYLGRYTPVDRDGNSLGKVFNVFAAPQDLCDPDSGRNVFTYLETQRRISHLENWHGHDGTNYETDKEFYEALKDGSYNGGWIIPTRELLRGKDMNDKATTPDNLYAHRKKGAFRNGFRTEESHNAVYPSWYWSSTKDRNSVKFAHCASFGSLDVNELVFQKYNFPLSCRPVRLVPVVNGGPHG